MYNSNTKIPSKEHYDKLNYKLTNEFKRLLNDVGDNPDLVKSVKKLRYLVWSLRRDYVSPDFKIDA